MGGLIVPAVFDGAARSTSRSSSASSTARSRTTPPTRSSPRTCATCRPRVARARRRRRPRVRRRRRPRVPRRRPGRGRCRARPPPRCVAAGILAKHPGATIVHNLICSKAVPEVIREHGGTPIRTRVGHSFIKQVMAETGAVVRRRALGALLLPRQLPRRLRDHRRDARARAAVAVRAMPLSELRKPFERYADSGEINTQVADPHAVDRAGRRRTTPTPSRTGSTASPSTSATGGSTCARRTPSRCCA